MPIVSRPKYCDMPSSTSCLLYPRSQLHDPSEEPDTGLSRRRFDELCSRWRAWIDCEPFRRVEGPCSRGKTSPRYHRAQKEPFLEGTWEKECCVRVSNEAKLPAPTRPRLTNIFLGRSSATGLDILTTGENRHGCLSGGEEDQLWSFKGR